VAKLAGLPFNVLKRSEEILLDLENKQQKTANKGIRLNFLTSFLLGYLLLVTFTLGVLDNRSKNIRFLAISFL
jgi:hypothetical protein